jgi:hypothetical protein
VDVGIDAGPHAAAFSFSLVEMVDDTDDFDGWTRHRPLCERSCT